MSGEEEEAVLGGTRTASDGIAAARQALPLLRQFDIASRIVRAPHELRETIERIDTQSASVLQLALADTGALKICLDEIVDKEMRDEASRAS